MEFVPKMLNLSKNFIAEYPESPISQSLQEITTKIDSKINNSKINPLLMNQVIENLESEDANKIWEMVLSKPDLMNYYKNVFMLALNPALNSVKK